METKKVDKYVAEIENGTIVTYAICGKEKIEIPKVFESMCDDQHKEIGRTSLEMPEVIGLPQGTEEYWMPLRTV